MIYPTFPKEGETIGICAPSAGVGAKLESFDTSLEVLKDKDLGGGFNIIETSSVRSEQYPSASAAARGAEFNQLYADPEVKLVFCASGGDFLMEMLPLIDTELIESNPKWFAGYSDPTSIEIYLATKFDMASIYGVNAGAFDRFPLHKFQEDALSVLKGNIPVQESYKCYSSSGFDEDYDGPYIMDAPVKWELFTPSGSSMDPASSLVADGRLIGGCIDVIDTIVGTDYEDFEGFCDRYKDDGFIWFFDNFAMDPLELTYALLKLKIKGLFEHANCVIIGRTLFRGEHSDLEYLSMIERVFADTKTPLIWNADIGHTKPSFTIINGSMGHIEFNNGDASLRMDLI